VTGLALAGCAVGDPKPTTYVTDLSATLNADVYSSVAGDTEYWWRYGETTAYGTETPHRTIAIADSAAHPVSEPIQGLSASTTYHFQLCVQDEGEDPPRAVCQSDRTFTTDSAGGRSGIAFTSGRTTPGFLEIWVMDEDGSNQTALTDGVVDENPSWSPDARRIAYMSNDGPGTGQDIWVMDADGGNKVNLTGDHETPFISSEDFPAWSPDGTKIAFESDRDADLENPAPTREIYLMNTDGSDPVRLTNTGNGVINEAAAWSPDGRRLCFFSNRDGDFDVYVMNANGSNPVNITNDSGSSDNECTWSPDGRRILYRSAQNVGKVWSMNPDGSDKTPLDGPDAPVGHPMLSADGDQLAFYEFNTGDGTGSVFTSEPDATDKVELTTDSTRDYWPVWSPRPAPAP
jgi:Tol biopolymer transport system component